MPGMVHNGSFKQSEQIHKLPCIPPDYSRQSIIIELYKFIFANNLMFKIRSNFYLIANKNIII